MIAALLFGPPARLAPWPRPQALRISAGKLGVITFVKFRIVREVTTDGNAHAGVVSLSCFFWCRVA